MSHQWAQGLLEYYLLTGDRDALEVALALGDTIFAQEELPEGVMVGDPNKHPMRFSFNRDLGWAVLSLVSLVEAGFDNYREYCDKVANYYQSVDYLSYKGEEVAGSNRSLLRGMVEYAYGYVCMIEAMDRYQKISKRKDTAQWFETLLHHLRKEAWKSINTSFININASNDKILQIMQAMHMMAIGFERTDDRDFLQAGLAILDVFFDILAMNALEHTWGELWGKNRESAMVYRSLSRFLAQADRAGLLEHYEFPTLQKKYGSAK